jgi:hypothetical protein
MRVWLLALAACSGVTGDPGYGRALQVFGAQFRPGGFPDATGGPATQSLVTLSPNAEIGGVRNRLHAVLDPDARAAIVGIAGADGAWLVLAGPPDIDTPGSPSATAVFGLAPATPPGPFTLLFAATDAGGRIGDPAHIDMIADAAPPPDGDLVVTLAWQGAADLDVHVVDPLGGEAWSGHPNTYKPPIGSPPDPTARLASGMLDRDKNSACERDNSAGEDVIWTTRDGPMGPVPPVIPAGTYTVRVDTPALCGDASAAWVVAVYAQGALVGSAAGVSTNEDTLYGHRAGAGVTALTFEQ